MKRFLLMGLVALLLSLPAGAAPEAAEPEISALRAVVMDADTGRLLYERLPDEKCLVASTTKLMSALVALETHALTEVVVIGDAAGAEGSSVYLKRGDRLRLETLLYGMLLESGNDAALAVAIHCAGSEAAFARLMNERAAAIGMKNTRFANASGLDDAEHYSTARDMALLMCECMRNPELARLTATRSLTVEGRYFRNHNRLLDDCEGADGGKTGFTKAAGRTLVSTAVRGGVRLVCVTLGAPDDWNDHKKLYDYAEAAYRWVSLDFSGELPVVSGVFDSVGVASGGGSFPVLPGETVVSELYLPKFVYAPLQNRQRVGAVRLLVNGEAAAESQIYTATACPERALRPRCG